MTLMPRPAAMKFGNLPRDPDIDPRSIPAAKRRAEIRCPKRHLVGVVTNDEVCLGGPAVPLTASHKEPTWCRDCGHHSFDYFVNIPALFSYLKERPTWRLRVPIEAVSTKRSFH